jgi:hypothetical protein
MSSCGARGGTSAVGTVALGPPDGGGVGGGRVGAERRARRPLGATGLRRDWAIATESQRRARACSDHLPS